MSDKDSQIEHFNSTSTKLYYMGNYRIFRTATEM